MEHKARINLEILIPQENDILKDERIQELMKQVKRLTIEVREVEKALNKRIEEIK